MIALQKDESKENQEREEEKKKHKISSGFPTTRDQEKQNPIY